MTLAPTYELRTVGTSFEIRGDAAAPVLEGYAATFNQEYDLGAFREVIDPAAFNRTLAMQPDIRLLVDHAGQPLARTKSGTLNVAPDDTGLRIRANLDSSDPDVQRLLPKMRRGDLDQMSFAFRVPAGGDSWSDDYNLRTLREVNMGGGDVSVVTYPANPATSVSVRAEHLLEARCVFAETLIRELRLGKAISTDNMAKLKQVLDMISAADDAVDKGQPLLAAVLGVPNPDADDDDAKSTDDAPPPSQANSGRPLGLALRLATALGV